MDAEASRILEVLGLSVTSLSEKAANLSSEQRQLLAIAKVMCLSPRLVIVDEPTEQLSYRSQQRLLALMHTLRQQGAAVVFGEQGSGASVCRYRPDRRDPGRFFCRDPSHG